MTFNFEAIGTQWQIDITEPALSHGIPASSHKWSRDHRELARGTEYGKCGVLSYRNFNPEIPTALKPAGLVLDSVRHSPDTTPHFPKDSAARRELVPTEGRPNWFAMIQERIEAFDRSYSRFREDSLVMQMSRQAGSYTLPEDAKPMFDLYEHLYRLTEGVCTPLIGSVLAEAGYDAAYTLKPGKINPPLVWDEAFDYQFPRLTLKKPALLDFGAAGKGYLIDLVGDLLVREGVRSYIIDAGGDILHRNAGDERIRVGLEHPENPRQVIGVVSVGQGSICGSAGNRRAWGNFHHIIDPRTLTSPGNIISVWVTAADALHADALTTVLYLGGLTAVRKHFDFEYCILNADYSFDKSAGFQAEMFTA